MATSEDDLAKKDIQDAIWDWGGKLAALGAVALLAFFSAWWLWGYGPNGAPALSGSPRPIHISKRSPRCCSRRHSS